MSDPGARVRVTSPRPVQRRRRRTGAAEIDARSQLGEIYLGSLLRAQLRLALGVLSVLLLIGGGLPVLFLAFPKLSEVNVAGFPLPWVLLAGAVYPVLFGLGWFYLRAAERNESDFTEAVER